MTALTVVVDQDRTPVRRKRRRGERFDLSGGHEPSLRFIENYKQTELQGRKHEPERSTIHKYMSFLSDRPCRGDLALATIEDWWAYLAWLDRTNERDRHVYRRWKYIYRLHEAATAAGLRAAEAGIPVPAVNIPAPATLERMSESARGAYERWLKVQDNLVKLRIDNEGEVGLAPESVGNKLRTVRRLLVEACERLRVERVDEGEITVTRIFTDLQWIATWLNERPAARLVEGGELHQETRKLDYHHVRGFVRWCERKKIVPVGTLELLTEACTPEGETSVVVRGRRSQEEEALTLDQVSDLITSLREKIAAAEGSWNPDTRAGAEVCYDAWLGYALVVSCIGGCCRPETLATMSLDKISLSGTAYVVDMCAYKVRRQNRWGRQYLCSEGYRAIEKMRSYRGKTMDHLDEPVHYRSHDTFGDTPIARARTVYHAWTDFNGRRLSVGNISDRLQRELWDAGIDAQPRRLRATGASVYLNVYARSPKEVAQIGHWTDYSVLFKHYLKRNEMEVYAGCEVDLGNLFGTAQPAEAALLREACREMISVLDLYASGLVGMEKTADLVRALLLLVEKIASTHPQYLPLSEWVVIPRAVAVAASRRLARETNGRLTLSDLLGMRLRAGLPLPGHATRKIAQVDERRDVVPHVAAPRRRPERDK